MADKCLCLGADRISRLQEAHNRTFGALKVLQLKRSIATLYRGGCTVNARQRIRRMYDQVSRGKE